jgi:hypothetical protein
VQNATSGGSLTSVLIVVAVIFVLFLPIIVAFARGCEATGLTVPVTHLHGRCHKTPAGNPDFRGFSVCGCHKKYGP